MSRLCVFLKIIMEAHEMAGTSHRGRWDKSQMSRGRGLQAELRTLAFRSREIEELGGFCLF
jgi:hypothetical protein